MRHFIACFKRKTLIVKIVYIIAILLLLFISFFPRCVEVLNKNAVFLLDQGRDYLAVRKIIVGHKLTLIGSEIGGGYAGFQGIFQGPFHYYFLAIPFILSDGDPASGVVLMFLFGLATIYAGYRLGNTILGKHWGLVMAMLIALSPPLINQSRFVWNPHPSTFFIILAFIFIYLLPQKNKLHLLLAGFFTAFTYNFEIAITTPLTITLLLYSLFFLRLKIKDLALILLGILIGFSPLFIFEIRHNFQAIHGTVSYLTSFHPGSSGNYGFINIRLDKFIYNLQDSFAKIPYLFTPLFPLFLLFSTIYSFFKEKKKNIKKFLAFFFLLIGITILVMSFLRNIIFMYYLIHLNIIYMFMFTYILYSSYRNFRVSLFICVSLIFLIMILTGIKFSYFRTLNDFNDYDGTSKIRAKKDAIDYIYKQAAGKKFNLLIFTPSVYTDPYDYLLLWYAQKKFHYLPPKEKKGDFYLLIEPELSRPWTYKGWLETVIKTGKVTSTQKLKSGHIVQKRVEESL